MPAATAPLDSVALAIQVAPTPVIGLSGIGTLLSVINRRRHLKATLGYRIRLIRHQRIY
ncbi:hypothetical protein [Roseicella aquatilis]|uniref:hypothetical protein n=1 Tax=Roseicella aquatilis TaxID=2527868 RepID=UPI001404D423|nr:hypothetical protein [Roseicella aquatilis]